MFHGIRCDAESNETYEHYWLHKRAASSTASLASVGVGMGRDKLRWISGLIIAPVPSPELTGLVTLAVGPLEQHPACERRFSSCDLSDLLFSMNSEPADPGASSPFELQHVSVSARHLDIVMETLETSYIDAKLDHDPLLRFPGGSTCPAQVPQSMQYAWRASS